MALIRKDPHKMFIDIDGPAGNAFSLLGEAQDLAKLMGLNKNKVIDEMTSGDYIHLLRTFNKYFSHVCDLHTDNETYFDALGDDK